MTQTYFQSLNYSMANEDTTLEYNLAEAIKAQSVLTVGGSGSRSLPFLGLGIKNLTIVDVSADQLMLIELKLETIRQLLHSEAIAFWTEENQDVRDTIFSRLKLANKFQDFYRYHSKAQPHSAPLYWGKWEKTFQTFSRLTKLFFSREIREGLFLADRPYEFYKTHIQGWKWNLLLKIVGNKAMFNSLLYKGSFIRKNSPLSYFDYYFQAFERLFQLDIKRSHFLQLCFCGKVLHPEALPIEFSADIFHKIKASNVDPLYQQGSIFERDELTQYDLISLSDVPSYLSGSIERDYLQLISKNISQGGVVVNRFYLRKSENTDQSGFQDITHEFRTLIAQELVQMYEVQLLRKV